MEGTRSISGRNGRKCSCPRRRPQWSCDVRCVSALCGLKSKEPPTFLGSFPRHYVLSVAERMTAAARDGSTLSIRNYMTLAPNLVCFVQKFCLPYCIPYLQQVFFENFMISEGKSLQLSRIHNSLCSLQRMVHGFTQFRIICKIFRVVSKL